MGLSEIDLSIGTLDFLGRRFNDLTLNASFRNGEWDSDISSKDISGKVSLYSQNKGKIVGRFKKLTMPSIYPTELPVVKKEQSEKIFPAIDIVIDNFVFRQ